MFHLSQPTEPGTVERFDYGGLRSANLAVIRGRACTILRGNSNAAAFLQRRRRRRAGALAEIGLELPFNGLAVTAGGLDTAAILADDGLRQLALELMDKRSQSECLRASPANRARARP